MIIILGYNIKVDFMTELGIFVLFMFPEPRLIMFSIFLLANNQTKKVCRLARTYSYILLYFISYYAQINFSSVITLENRQQLMQDFLRH